MMYIDSVHTWVRF